MNKVTAPQRPLRHWLPCIDGATMDADCAKAADAAVRERGRLRREAKASPKPAIPRPPKPAASKAPATPKGAPTPPASPRCKRCGSKAPCADGSACAARFEERRRKREAAEQAERDRRWRERGPRMWAELHDWSRTCDVTNVDAVAAWLNRFVGRIGCGQCKGHFVQMLEDKPATLASNDALYAWTIDRHNDVNRRIGKPVWGLVKA